MKILLTLVALLGGLSNCFAQCDSIPISITIKVDKEYYETYSKNGGYIKDVIRRNNYVVKSDSIKEKFFDISLSIRNSSDKTIKIWLMTCSWENNFIVNNNYIYIRGHECDSNFPILVEFKPGESKMYTNTLTKSIKFDYPCEYCVYGPQVETTKLGLIIIDDIFNPNLDMLSYNNAMDDKSKCKIVWSNTLYLLTKSEAHPKPVQIPLYQNGEK
jgi:hypothetical protein